MDARDEEIELAEATAKVPNDKVERYDAIRADALARYNAFTPANCPALKNHPVTFPAEGFNHLVYRIPKQERHRRVQIMRFELLDKARRLLEISTTMQEYEEYYDEVVRWMNKKKTKIATKISDIGFVGIINGYRIKVVVRKIGNGNFEFLSVIPAWSTKYYRGIKIVRQVKGNVAD